MFHVIYKGLILFDYTKSVSPLSRSHADAIFMRFRVAVCFPIPTHLIPGLDPNLSRQPDSCEHTKWEINLYTTTVAALAQITIAIRSTNSSQDQNKSLLR